MLHIVHSLNQKCHFFFKAWKVLFSNRTCFQLCPKMSRLIERRRGHGYINVFFMIIIHCEVSHICRKFERHWHTSQVVGLKIQSHNQFFPEQQRRNHPLNIMASYRKLCSISVCGPSWPIKRWGWVL